MAIISGFHPQDEGSIPSIRSKFWEDSVIGSTASSKVACLGSSPSLHRQIKKVTSGQLELWVTSSVAKQKLYTSDVMRRQKNALF